MSNASVFKIVTAGDGGVGKTTLLHRYVTNVFLADTSMTIGVQLHVKQMIYEEKTYTLQLWDLGGQDRFRFVLPQYVNGAKGALLVFDLTRVQSTFDLESSWLPIVRRENPNLPVLLVGTKKDMISSSNPMIDPSIPEKLLNDNHLQGYIEVSSESGENVESTFIMLLEAMLGKL